jgi:hypothetical protein
VSYGNYDPTTNLGPGEQYSRRAVRTYHPWTIAAMWASFVGGAVLLIVANTAFDFRSSWFSVLQVGGIALACVWVALLVWWSRLRRTMVLRRRNGRCLCCGYLRPHHASGLCSECGTVPWWDDHELH